MTDDRVPAGDRPRHVLVANPSADLYGSDRMLLEAVRGFLARGWRVTVTCSQSGPLVEPLTAAGAEVVVRDVPVLRKASTNPKGLVLLAAEVARSLPGLIRFVRELRPDAVYVNTVTVPIWILISRLTRTPVVAHVHEAEASVRPILRKALAAPLGLATLVIFNSAVSRAVSGSRAVERRRRARVVHNGVDGPPSVVPARSELTRPLRLVYVGRLSPRKGVDLVVDAARSLIAEGIDTRVDLVGAVFPSYEWYEEELRAQVAASGLLDAVAFHGFQPVIWSFLSDADVAVVPSRLDESFGNTVIEALLSARPVVVSDHTGLREAATGFESALLVPRDDVDALTRALAQVHDRWDSYRSAAERESRVAAERYGVARYRAAVAAVIDEVAHH